MAALVLDRGAISFLARPSRLGIALIRELRERGYWPARVPSAVLIECLQGHAGRDADANRFLRTCEIVEHLPEGLARRAAWLRTRARRGSAVDALLVAMAEPGGAVLTGDPGNLEALAARGDEVRVWRSG